MIELISVVLSQLVFYSSHGKPTEGWNVCGEHTCSSSFYEEESRVNTRNVISGVADSIAHRAGWGWGQTEAPPGGTATPLLQLTVPYGMIF